LVVQEDSASFGRCDASHDSSIPRSSARRETATSRRTAR
jgi:hypothetical protein